MKQQTKNMREKKLASDQQTEVEINSHTGTYAYKTHTLVVHKYSTVQHSPAQHNTLHAIGPTEVALTV